jgi:membrane protease subunit (stomatin/prohibitin family)
VWSLQGSSRPIAREGPGSLCDPHHTISSNNYGNTCGLWPINAAGYLKRDVQSPGIAVRAFAIQWITGNDCLDTMPNRQESGRYAGEMTMFHSFRDAAMAETVKFAGAVLLATLIGAGTAAAPFDFDSVMKSCDDSNKIKSGSCKKTSTKMKVIHGCFNNQKVCFICLNGKCYSATGENKVIKDNNGKSFVVGVNGIPHHLPLVLRRNPPATNGDLIDACSSVFPDCGVLENDDMTVIVVDLGASSPGFKIECVDDSRGRKGCHVGK